MEPLDLRLDIVGSLCQIVDAAGTINPSRDQLGIAGEQPQDIDVFEETRIMAVRADRETPLVVLRHQKERFEDEVVCID
jgi:hypothetical protein